MENTLEKILKNTKAKVPEKDFNEFYHPLLKKVFPKLLSNEIGSLQVASIDTICNVETLRVKYAEPIATEHPFDFDPTKIYEAVAVAGNRLVVEIEVNSVELVKKEICDFSFDDFYSVSERETYIEHLSNKIANMYNADFLKLLRSLTTTPGTNNTFEIFS